ncbi:MAG: hypothetical protein ACYYK0_01020 [Candidatus Eutrophobiaceae bacterium]
MQSRRKRFIAGTDAGVGKTRHRIGVDAPLSGAGVCVLGMKPIASGAQAAEEGVW